MAKFKILKEPQLRRLIFASIPADLADWLDYTVIAALFAYFWQTGPFPLAMFAIALGLPYLVAGPFVGALVDRSDLRMVLIVSNLGRALVTAMLIFAPSVTLVLILVFVRGVVDSAFTPARQSSVQLLARKDQLSEVNSLVYGINQLSKMVGPALGGVLLIWFTPQSIFAINTIMSLLAVALIWRIVIPARKSVPIEEGSNIFSDALAGFSEVKGNAKILLAILFTAAAMFAIFLYDAFLPLLTVEFGFPIFVFGLSVGLIALGGVIGAFIVGKIEFGERHLEAMIGAALVGGAGIMGVGLFAYLEWVPPIVVFVAIFFGIGLAGAFIHIPYVTLLQIETPEDKMARVIAIGQAASVIAMLSSPFLGGILAHQFGIAVPFIVGGGVLIFASVVGLVFTLGRVAKP